MTENKNVREFIPLDIAVLTVSDSRTEETDKSGKRLVERLEEAGHRLAEKKIVLDDTYQIRAAVSNWIAAEDVQIVLTTGGTGVTGRDGTPEAVSVLLDKTIEGFNPLCGDKLTLYLKIDGQKINDIAFDGSGCAISVASASLMTDAMKGKSLAEAETLFNEFHNLITTDDDVDTEHLGKLAALAGVKDYPARVKCASLCWHTLHSAILGDDDPVSTE